MEEKKYFQRKRRLGDRYDGWKVRSKDPLFAVIPHIMRSRLDCQVHMEERFDITELERLVRRLRRETDMTDLSLLVVVMTACVRAFSQYPKLNRFVCGRKIYARNDLSFSLVVKKEMRIDGDETIIKPSFRPDSTIHDVWEVVHKEFEANKNADSKNGTDVLAKLLSIIPGFVLKFIVWLVRSMDSFGIMPKFIGKLSPFHTSLFITDVGSVGLASVYHHLYEFGTCSVFLAIGKKEKTVGFDKDGNVTPLRTINFKFVIDERITDGFYNGKIFNELRRLIKKPELLLEPPAKVAEDDLT